MTQTVAKNEGFGAKLLHILTLGTRDFYKTADGQKISMRAGQGSVEVDDNGEINIFDAVNVRAKGVNGKTDVFNLFDCTGNLTGCTGVKEVGDIFRPLSRETEEETSDGNSNLDNLFQELLNQMMQMLQSLLGLTSQPTDSAQPAEPEEPEKVEKPEESEESEEPEQPEQSEQPAPKQPTNPTPASSAMGFPSLQINNNVSGSFNNVDITNNVYYNAD